jgi:hypothetical protein
MRRTHIVFLRADAPPKPPAGAACNGCGVCCAVEPCPLAMLVFRRRHGPCPALDWREGERGQRGEARYVCGLLLAPERHLPRLPPGLRRFVAPVFRHLVTRWIAAGRGCDSTVVPQDEEDEKDGKDERPNALTSSPGP